MQRTKSVRVRLTPDEILRLKAAAVADGRSVSDYVRRVAVPKEVKS